MPISDKERISDSKMPISLLDLKFAEDLLIV